MLISFITTNILRDIDPVKHADDPGLLRPMIDRFFVISAKPSDIVNKKNCFYFIFFIFSRSENSFFFFKSTDGEFIILEWNSDYNSNWMKFLENLNKTHNV